MCVVSPQHCSQGRESLGDQTRPQTCSYQRGYQGKASTPSASSVPTLIVSLPSQRLSLNTSQHHQDFDCQVVAVSILEFQSAPPFLLGNYPSTRIKATILNIGRHYCPLVAHFRCQDDWADSPGQESNRRLFAFEVSTLAVKVTPRQPCWQGQYTRPTRHVCYMLHKFVQI